MRFNSTLFIALSLGLGACTYASPALSELECAPDGVLDDARECVDGIWIDRGRDLDAGVDVSGEDAELDVGGSDSGADASCGPFDDDVLCAAVGFDCGTARVGDMCGGEQDVFCGACPDGSSCRDNVCVQGCDCVIDDECYVASASKPDGPCLVCDPARNSREWSNADAGTSCSDGFFCTDGDVCDGGGVCTPGPDRDCSGVSGGGSCVVGSCDEDADECVVEPAPVDTPCDNGDPDLDCTTIACDGAGQCITSVSPGACFAAGECVMARESPAGNECVICLPFNSQTELSNRSAGEFCGVTSACGTSTCDGAGACSGFEQNAGCIIDGVCVGEDDVDPMNPCNICKPAQDVAGWSANTGASCADDGLACTFDVCDASGQCAHDSIAADTCLFRGVECLGSGDVSEAGSGCTVCQPDGSFSDFMDGSGCTTCASGVCECVSGSCVDM